MRYHNNKKKPYTFISLIILTLSLLLQGCGKHAQDNPALPEENSEYINAENPQLPNSADTTFQPEEAPQVKTIKAGADSLISSALSGDSQDVQTLQTGDTSIVSKALHVNGASLTDSTGTPVQLKGISTHGLAWFPDYVNESCFRQLKEDWGVNVIRLAMYTAEYGGYCTGGDKEYLKELVKNGVECATRSDLYVIIDWHILSDGNPNTYKEESKAFFAEMAQLYADYDNVLYEICNEPNGGTSWNDIKSYAEEVIPVIRTYDKDAVILIGTPNWSQYVDHAAANPITGYDNIMYTLHFYAGTHTDSLRNTMVAAIESGLPVFVSEYGICDASGNGAIDEYQAEQWITLMDQYGVSYVAWNLSNKAETSALISSACNKTSDFTENDLSASGKWLYQVYRTKSSHPVFMSSLPASRFPLPHVDTDRSPLHPSPQ